MNVHGNTQGLKPNQIRRLEHIYRRRTAPNSVCSLELLKNICSISREINRQIGVLLNRRGSVEFVIVGDHKSIVFPELERSRSAPGRLKGLRFVHTHLKNESLSSEDLTDLSLLRLDYLIAVETLADGMPGFAYQAHLVPLENGSTKVNILPKTRIKENGFDFVGFINNLEDEIRRKVPVRDVKEGYENGIIVTAAKRTDDYLKESIDETKELAKTCRVNVVDVFTQYRNEPDPKYLIGKGKLRELIIRAMEVDADILIFNQNLSPSLARRISDTTNLKIIDRTQLILDVFAQRAKSSDGKLQVELAQLKYTLPRLIEKDTMMSRLTGGIGGRGPGETKLEINRRRAQERMERLSREIESLGRARAQKRSMRKKGNLPTVSIVGYTNAGKSTLLNNLTNSSVSAENRPFSTLDPASRRLRFPREREIIITDTVGFIRDLPEELVNAFRATLEEIGDADLILHIVDVSNANYKNHIEAVERILKNLNHHAIPRIFVANKIDRADPHIVERERRNNGAVPISAIDKDSFSDLIEAMDRILWPMSA